MSNRLIIAIISTLLEEAALAIVVLIGLPKLDIHLPLFVLIILMIAWAVIAVLIYRSGSRALRIKVTSGPEAMVGMKGKVVRPLDPEGMVRIDGELWRAKSAGEKIDSGEEVIVTERRGTILIVQAADEQA